MTLPSFLLGNLSNSATRRFLGHIQIDDPILVSFCDEKLRQLMLKEGVDPEVLLDTYIRVLNGCIAEKPSDLLVSVHICRGNVRVRPASPMFRCSVSTR